jgi:hypothetical protein
VILNYCRAPGETYELFFIDFYYWWGETESLGTAATSGLLYKPQMIDEDDCGAIGGMKIGRGNLSTRRKPAPAPLCPPQIPHDQTRARTPDRCGGKPATNRVSYGAAYQLHFIAGSRDVLLQSYRHSPLFGCVYSILPQPI